MSDLTAWGREPARMKEKKTSPFNLVGGKVKAEGAIPRSADDLTRVFGGGG